MVLPIPRLALPPAFGITKVRDKTAVLVAQMFAKIPLLRALAPTQSEPAFAIAEAFVLFVFGTLTWKAAVRFVQMPRLI